MEKNDKKSPSPSGDINIHLKNRVAELREVRHKGTRIVGFFPGSYVPEELIHASGHNEIEEGSVRSQIGGCYEN